MEMEVLKVLENKRRKGLKTKTFSNINNGTLPKRVVIGMIEQDSYVGAYNRNPFNFKHFDLTKLSLAVDNVNVPHSPIETNFADGKFANAYYSLFHGVDRGPLNSGNFVTKNDFINGYALFAFDLTPDKSQGDHFNLIRKGILSLTLSFAQSVPENINVLAYMEFDDLLEITKDRAVFRHLHLA